MKFRVEQLESRRVMAVSVVSPLPDVVLPAEVASHTISLAGRFDDTAVTGTIVRLQTNLAAPYDRVFFELFDQAGPGRERSTPITAANFLRYAEASRYDNTFLHRSVPGFVVQGGGYRVATGLPRISTFDPIVNEPGNSNVRGTIAMAKIGEDSPGGGPDSATSEWFVNLGNNSANLDFQNGGFTVFGRVLGSGIGLFDGVASLPRYDIRAAFGNGALNETPLLGAPAPPLPANYEFNASNFISFPTVTRVGELVYTVQSSNPTAATATIDGNGAVALSLLPGVSGTVTITVRATSVHDTSDFAEDSFTITRATGDAPTAVVGRIGNEVWLARSSGTAFSSTRLSTLPGSDWASIVTGDFNGDGRDDIASLAATGQWSVALTPANGSAAPTTWGTWSMATPWTSIVAGDFNGDGKTDIAGRNGSGAWLVARSTGSSFTTSRFGAWSTMSGNWTNILAADFDGDGRTDIAGRLATTGSWWVSRSTGTAFTNTMFGTWARTTTWADVTTGDFNGDGKADIIGRNAAGGWWVSRSTGSSFATTRFGSWSTAIQWADVRAADFDGDGRTDLAGRDRTTGMWHLAKSLGTSFVNSRIGAWSAAATWVNVIAGDFDGDGRADLAGRASTGQWTVTRKIGVSPITAAFGSWSTAAPWHNVAGVRS